MHVPLFLRSLLFVFKKTRRRFQLIGEQKRCRACAEMCNGGNITDFIPASLSLLIRDFGSNISANRSTYRRQTCNDQNGGRYDKFAVQVCISNRICCAIGIQVAALTHGENVREHRIPIQPVKEICIFCALFLMLDRNIHTVVDKALCPIAGRLYTAKTVRVIDVGCECCVVHHLYRIEYTCLLSSPLVSAVSLPSPS